MNVGNLHLDQFVQAERERQERQRAAWARYRGTWPKPLRATRTDPKAADNVVLNFARVIVNIGVAALFGFTLDLEVGTAPGTDSQDSPEEQWLEQCLLANGGMVLLHKLARCGAVTGQAILKLMLPDPARNGHPYPRIVVWDPAEVSARWDPEDYEHVLSLARAWHGVDSQRVLPVAYRQVVSRQDGGQWEIRDEESTGTAASYREQRPAEVWPWPWCPVLWCQNLADPCCWWGMADLEPDVLELNEAINFGASNMQRIQRVHAHPRTWGAGFLADELNGDVDGVITLPDPQATLQNLEMQGDMSGGLELLRVLRETLHEKARVPEVATGKVENLGQLSGLALQILYRPLTEVTSEKRLTYGGLVQELGRRLLEMGGFGAEHLVTLQWPAVVPSDRKTDTETGLLEEQVGVSKNTVLTRLGFDPVKEAELRDQEQQADQALGERLLSAFERNGVPA